MTDHEPVDEPMPLVDAILDDIVAAVLDPGGAPDPVASVARDVLDLVARHEGGTDLAYLLAAGFVDLLTEAADDAEDTPPDAVARLVQVAGLIADGLPEQQALDIHLARFPLLADARLRRADIRRAWVLLQRLDPELRGRYAIDVAAVAWDCDEPELAGQVARYGLAYTDPADTGDLEVRRLLHAIVASSIGAGDQRQGAAYLARLLEREPELSCDETHAVWFRSLLSELALQGQAEAPAAIIAPLIAELRDHPNWWPQDRQLCGLASLALAKASLAVLDNEGAARWLAEADRHLPGDRESAAERGLLAAELAYASGHAQRLPTLLVRAAPAVKGEADPEHLLRWLQLAEAVLRARQDTGTADDAHGLLRDLIRQMGGPPQAAGLGDAATLSQVYELHRRAMDVQQRAARGRTDAADLTELRDILAELPDGYGHLRAGLLSLLAGVATMQGRPEEAAAALADGGAELAALRAEPPGGFPADLLGQHLAAMEAVAEFSRDPGSGYAIAALARVRAAADRAGNAAYSALLATMLSLMHLRAGDPDRALAEALAALAHHTRTAATIPDARERASVQRQLETVVAAALAAAHAAGRREVMAELLEVVRAQPIPLARTKIPATELSFAALLADLAPLATRAGAGGAAATGATAHAEPAAPWLAWESHTPNDGTDPPTGTSDVEPSAVLLRGVPSIAMPWGPAAGDRLRDPQVAARVTVRVLRGPLEV